jgi:hypothetical protein
MRQPILLKAMTRYLPIERAGKLMAESLRLAMTDRRVFERHPSPERHSPRRARHYGGG